MFISKAKPGRITKKPKLEEKRSLPFKDAKKRCPTLKELQERKYAFSDLDLFGILDDLLEKWIIQLPKPKRPKEVGRTANPNIVGIIGWLVTLLKSASRLNSTSCNLLKIKG